MPLADITEATAETGSDEIREYAENLFNDIQAERQGEPERKSDAQIANEHADTSQPGDKTKETLAEKNSGNETALEGEETGTVEVPEWMSDDVIAEASAYGINESELSEFTSREELDRALRLFDKTALEAGRKALAESDEKEGSTRNEKGQFVKKEEPKADPPKDSTPKDGRYQVTLSPDLYDEEIIGEFSRLVDHYESRLGTLESFIMEQKSSAEEQRFDSFVDSLGHTDLFGTTGEETEKELQRRNDLVVAVKAQMIGLANLGRPTQMSKELVSRVANMVFGDELSKKRLKQQTRKISRQSNGRLGGSPTKPLSPRDDPRAEADRLYRELSGS